MSCFFVQDELLCGYFVLIIHDEVHIAVVNRERGVKHAAFREYAGIDILLRRLVPLPPVAVLAHFRRVIGLLLGSLRLFVGSLCRRIGCFGGIVGGLRSLCGGFLLCRYIGNGSIDTVCCCISFRGCIVGRLGCIVGIGSRRFGSLFERSVFSCPVALRLDASCLRSLSDVFIFLPNLFIALPRSLVFLYLPA